jgi:hypothetical protein
MMIQTMAATKIHPTMKRESYIATTSCKICTEETCYKSQFNTIWSGGLFGKNYALFGVPNKTHPEAEDAVYAEIDIAPVHRVQQVILDESNHISLYNVFGK